MGMDTLMGPIEAIGGGLAPFVLGTCQDLSPLVSIAS